jgi:hypothetical protein
MLSFEQRPTGQGAAKKNTFRNKYFSDGDIPALAVRFGRRSQLDKPIFFSSSSSFPRLNNHLAL